MQRSLWHAGAGLGANNGLCLAHTLYTQLRISHRIWREHFDCVSTELFRASCRF